MQEDLRGTDTRSTDTRSVQILRPVMIITIIIIIIIIVITVRVEIITELILKRAGPVIFKTFLLELIVFRPIPVVCPARGVKPENCWKRELIPSRAHPAKKISYFSEIIPGNIFRIRYNFGPDSLMKRIFSFFSDNSQF